MAKNELEQQISVEAPTNLHVMFELFNLDRSRNVK